MKHTILLAFAMLLLCYAHAQKKWTGLGNDGLWNNSNNWTDNEIPLETDSLVLDNSYAAGTYTVSLPSSSVLIKYLVIKPQQGNEISLILPSTNILDTAFRITGKGYSMVLNEGAVFKNSSDAPKGYGLYLGDSLKICNGGKYIHNTKRSNANIVKFLSVAPGTEQGTFEFDVPGTTGYTPSLTGRTFGTLIFSATSAGKRTYSCTGSNVVTIRNELKLTGDVTLSLGFSADILVKGNLVQQGGVLNLDNVSKSANANTMRIGGNIEQAPNATITHTGIGNPSIELNSAIPQTINMKGTITTDIEFIINNSKGVSLVAPLMLPYKLNLQNGCITTTNENLLTLQSRGWVQVSDLLKNYINGPLRKEGLNNETFLFPVGHNEAHGVKLVNVSGNYTVEYKDDNIQGNKSNELAFITPKGYFNIVSDNAVAAGVSVAYKNNDGSATENVFIAQYESDVWTKHTSVYNNEFISSDNLSLVKGDNYFTLAHSAAFNILPFHYNCVKLQRINDQLSLKWSVSNDPVERFVVERSLDGENFVARQVLACAKGITDYLFTDEATNGTAYYRIKAIEANGKCYVSKVVYCDKANEIDVTVLNTLKKVSVVVHCTHPSTIQLNIFSMNGSFVKHIAYNLKSGKNIIPFETNELQDGINILQIKGNDFGLYTTKFLK